jgi:hemolysin activation/secretion protein
LRDSLVLAWEIKGCARSGQIPLWDTCRLGLRGFPATDYLGKKSLHAQAELRWRFYKRWGLVGFAGAGRMDDSLGGYGEDETIPSYGAGIRFMVMESQRINVRVDYARSDRGNEAWYLSVTEAF